MFAASPLLILLILLFVGAIVYGLGLAFGSGSSRSKGGGFSLGHANLNCPHCGEATRADVPTCEHCGQDL